MTGVVDIGSDSLDHAVADLPAGLARWARATLDRDKALAEKIGQTFDGWQSARRE